MNVSPRSTFDPAKILGPYPLLAAFLLVLETLLGFWFFRAESSSERIIAGLLMVLAFGGFLYTVIRVVSQKQEDNKLNPHGLGQVTPASEEITAKQIEVLEPEKLIGPDRSYIINRPSDDWSIRQLTEAEWRAESLGVNDPTAKQLFTSQPGQGPEILVIETKSINSVIPIPGKTTIDGVMLPTALETPLFTQLAIIPIDRAQPPLYIERPLVHNFFQTASLIFSTNLMTLYKQWSSIIPNTQRQQIVAEFRQTIRHSLFNGNEIENLAYSMLLIGIEGDIRDFILLVKYPSLPDTSDAGLEQDLQTIQSIINSFRPVKILNPEKQLKEFREKADQISRERIAQVGEKAFIVEFSLLVLRISALDLDNPDNLLRVMKLLRPFKLLSEQMNFQDKGILALGDALQQAEKGNALELKQMLTAMIELAKASMNSSADQSTENQHQALSTDGNMMSPSSNNDENPINK